MKILHVAVFSPISTNIWQADAFEELGHEVVRYDFRQRACELEGRIRNVNPKRDEELIDLCKTEKPDMVLYSKCNQMDIRVVEEHNKTGATTILWFMDTKTYINKELILKMKECDYIFCSSWDGINTAKKHNENVFRLQGGHNPEVHYPMSVPKIRDVAFIGWMYGLRNRYRRFVEFDVINGVYNEDHSRTVSETKINLSFSEGNGISNRIYKILAAKGFVLTNPWHRMEEDFTAGKDFQIFRNPNELKHWIKYYLENEEEREEIAEHGYKTVQKYDNINYARRIVDVVNG